MLICSQQIHWANRGESLCTPAAELHHLTGNSELQKLFTQAAEAGDQGIHGFVDSCDSCIMNFNMLFIRPSSFVP